MFKINFKDNEEEENIYNDIPTLNLNDSIIICKFKEIDKDVEINNYVKNFEDIEDFDDLEEE